MNRVCGSICFFVFLTADKHMQTQMLDRVWRHNIDFGYVPLMGSNQEVVNQLTGFLTYSFIEMSIPLFWLSCWWDLNLKIDRPATVSFTWQRTSVYKHSYSWPNGLFENVKRMLCRGFFCIQGGWSCLCQAGIHALTAFTILSWRACANMHEETCWHVHLSSKRKVRICVSLFCFHPHTYD